MQGVGHLLALPALHFLDIRGTPALQGGMMHRLARRFSLQVRQPYTATYVLCTRSPDTPCLQSCHGRKNASSADMTSFLHLLWGVTLVPLRSVSAAEWNIC